MDVGEDTVDVCVCVCVEVGEISAPLNFAGNLNSLTNKDYNFCIFHLSQSSRDTGREDSSPRSTETRRNLSLSTELATFTVDPDGSEKKLSACR